MGLGWTHNICEECYRKKFPGREPMLLVNFEWDECCFCNEKNIDGIYIRCDPKETKCTHDPI